MICYIGESGRLNCAIQNKLDLVEVRVFSDRGPAPNPVDFDFVIYGGRDVRRWKEFFHKLPAQVPVLFLSTDIPNDRAVDWYQRDKIDQELFLSELHPRVQIIRIPFVEEFFPDCAGELSLAGAEDNCVSLFSLNVTKVSLISDVISCFLNGEVSTLRSYTVKADEIVGGTNAYRFWTSLYSYAGYSRARLPYVLVKALEKAFHPLRLAGKISVVFVRTT